MTREEIDTFEKTRAQLESLHVEIGALSKKAQNEAINKFKLKFINQTIATANTILEDKYKPFGDFDQFEEDDVPSNSDVTMLLGQYLNCLEKLRDDSIVQNHGYWYWRIDGEISTVRTKAPNRLSK
ncbi:hypothetical protein OQX63_17305 [Pedobacter sp. PF22-3]|uniref:hypothetical protein n=1 Tax=Pedobacter sp. PF22-3 TaxID=2994467 RepID=UPI002245E099|nr:hypothetical protein [Pedobacter sp. PF22-3]MCX2495251.1 hypothetical protein [Pedobacter sp. PF22-3]